MATRIEFARKKLTLNMDAGTTLSQVIESVERNLQAPRPSKCTFLWLGKRDNNRQELDIHRQRLVIEQIRNLGMAANEMAVTQASLYLIPTTIQAIIEQKEYELGLTKKKFLYDMAKINDDFMALEHASTRRNHENNALMMDNRKKQAEIDLIQQQTEELRLKNEVYKKYEPQKQRLSNKSIKLLNLNQQAETALLKTNDKMERERIRLIQSVINKMNFDELDPWLASYIATTLANPNQKTEYGEHRLNGLLEQHIVNEGEAKMLLAKQNAELQKKKVEEQDLSNKNKQFNLDLKKKDYEV